MPSSGSVVVAELHLTARSDGFVCRYMGVMDDGRNWKRLVGVERAAAGADVQIEPQREAQPRDESGELPPAQFWEAMKMGRN
jgi:hypothetical protein